MANTLQKSLAAVVGVGALAVGGSAIANATTSHSTAATTTSTSSSGSTSTPVALPAGMPAPGTAAHEDAEHAVTGDAAEKTQAAAVKDVGSGTAGAVTTDFSGTGYEVTVTKSDGSTVEVHLDSSFTARHDGPGGPPPGPR